MPFKISEERNAQRKLDEAEDDSDDDEDLGKIRIHMDDDVKLNDVFDLDKPNKPDEGMVVLDDVEDL